MDIPVSIHYVHSKCGKFFCCKLAHKRAPVWLNLGLDHLGVFCIDRSVGHLCHFLLVSKCQIESSSTTGLNTTEWYWLKRDWIIFDGLDTGLTLNWRKGWAFDCSAVVPLKSNKSRFWAWGGSQLVWCGQGFCVSPSFFCVKDENQKCNKSVSWWWISWLNFKLPHARIVGFLRGGCSRGGGNWGTLRIPREDWGTLGNIMED